MGWDAFGMPAENAAMQNKVHPKGWTYDNIAAMRKQLKSMGLSLDWSREFATCDVDYYHRQQYLFLDFLEKGLVYRKQSKVNWDPVDHTVLANEQVIDGRGWRSGALVEQRELTQWFFRITDFSQDLLDSLEALDQWPEKVRLMQKNWIGRSEGMLVRWEVSDGAGLTGETDVTVYTTRPDTLFGASFLAISADHPLARDASARNPEIMAFCEECRRAGTSLAALETAEKKGMDTGIRVRHPFDPSWELPVYVANFVLMDYGTGAIFGCPSGDQRDLDFARKYDLPVVPVVMPKEADAATFAIGDEAYVGDGVMINSHFLDGLSTEEAFEEVARRLTAATLGNAPVGERKVNFRLRDWGISRQRYWGCPIPVIHCEACGVVPVPKADLPVKLPDDVTFDKPGNPLDRHPTWRHVACPHCGKDARRETDTMDTFVDSSWYFMRYTSPGNDQAMVDSRNDYWMPMDQYIGGIEHAVLHLLYARFWTRVMRDLGLVNFDEPFTRLLCQGMVLNHIYSRKNEQGGIEYFWPDEVEDIHDAKGVIVGARLRSDGSAVQYGGIGTMSKSKNNGVDPQSLIDSMGADTARLFVMFASPPEQTLEWSDSGVEGAHRFLRRLWGLCHAQQAALRDLGPEQADWSQADSATKTLRREVYGQLKQADYDYQRIQYNTVVSACMKMLNTLESAALPDTPIARQGMADALGVLLRVLYPVVPHVTWLLWRELGYQQRHGDILDAPWPQVDEAALVADEVELMLQVNGKLRGSILVANGTPKPQIEQQAAGHEAVARFLEGRPVKRVIVVPGKLVNVVG